MHKCFGHAEAGYGGLEDLLLLFQLLAVLQQCLIFNFKGTVDTLLPQGHENGSHDTEQHKNDDQVLCTPLSALLVRRSLLQISSIPVIAHIPFSVFYDAVWHPACCILLSFLIARDQGFLGEAG